MSVYLSACLFVSLSVYLLGTLTQVYLFVCLHICLLLCIPVCRTCKNLYLSVCLSVYFSVNTKLSTHQSTCKSICLSADRTQLSPTCLLICVLHSIQQGSAALLRGCVLRAYCGRCCLCGRGLLHRSPHSGPGGAAGAQGIHCIGPQRGPNRKHRSCDTLGDRKLFSTRS